MELRTNNVQLIAVISAVFFIVTIESASAISCYKCRSVDNSNFGCSDPFDYMRKIERRECPNYERCAKITGTNSQGQYFVIRDCYRTNFEPRTTSYTDKRIQYYQDMVDGEISICKLNMCNGTFERSQMDSLIVVLIMFFVSLVIMPSLEQFQEWKVRSSMLIVAMAGLLIFPTKRLFRGIANFWAGDEAIADTMAGDLKTFLLVDISLRDLDQKKSNWNRFKQSLLRIFVVFVHWFAFLRFIVLEVTRSEDKLDMLGEVYRFFGGNRKYYTATALFLNFFGVYFSLFSWIYQNKRENRKRVELWLRPLEVLAGRKAPETIGLTIKNMKDIRGRARLCTNIIFVFTYLSTIAYMILIPRIYLAYYSKVAYDKYWPLLIFWKIQFDISTFFIMGALSTSLCYFSLLCLIYRERYQNINKRVINDFLVIGAVEDEQKRLKITQLMADHNQVCEDLDRTNHYWSHFVIASFLTYIPLICIIAFQLLFIKKKYYFKITLIVMFLQYCGMLSGTCLSAATVSNRALRGHPKFCSLMQRYKVPTAELLNYTKLLMRFEGEPIGFTCHNFFVLTDETYSKVIIAIISYFLLLALEMV